MKVNIFFLVLSLTLFHTGQACENLFTHGEVYTFQNSDNNQCLTAAPQESSSLPSALMTNCLSLPKQEQLWEVNVASDDNESKTRVLIRALNYYNNSATFEDKYCTEKRIWYRIVVYFHCEPVNPNYPKNDTSKTSWYLKRAEWDWKDAKWASSKCLTSQKNGPISFSDCSTNEKSKKIQQWKINLINT